MLALNDIQQAILRNIRGGREPSLPITADEIQELRELILACEGVAIREELQSMVDHAEG